MLFIPGATPSNYYSRDFEPGLQLYSSGVMIMDKCADLLPEHFRFMRGVVDTADLSLNISRELLQHDRQLRVIAQSLTKRVKSELKKLMDEDPDKYKAFWGHFGLQLKYATISEFGMNKSEVSDLLMFNSAHAKSLISLQQYVDAMPDAQKSIYYAFGADASKLPQAEPVLDAGFDVLCLVDDTDEFVMQSLATFDGKPFVSVNSDDLQLPDADKKNEETDKQEADSRELLDFVKDALNGEVADVKLSRKLKTAPVCLSTQGPITLEMERYFKSLPASEVSATMKAERVLELNGSHKSFETLKAAFGADTDKAARLAKLFYYQSQLLAGIELSDPAELAELIAQTI
jgi:molecular chaperone HtpG